MSSPSVVPVVCALIEREGRVLIAQRPAHKHLPLAWEFPGGKVEPGETPEAALVREIAEELGCRIQIAKPLPGSRHAYPSVTVDLLPFLASLTPDSPEPSPSEHIAIQWVNPANLLSFDLAPADLPIVASYLQQHRQ